MQDNSTLNDLMNQFSSGGQETLIDFVINFCITILVSFIMGKIYTKYGTSLSNRNKLAQTFVLISLTVMLVITIVKSSLALSLGLVGALSIVRFRTAVKEPEELVYFFIAIAFGLGLGANQRIITLVGALIIIIYIVVQSKMGNKRQVQQNLILTVSNQSNRETGIEESKIIELLEKHCSQIELRRFDEINDVTEISLSVEFAGIDNIINAKNELKSLGDLEFSFVESY